MQIPKQYAEDLFATQPQIAKVLRVERRQIANYVIDGLPRFKDGRRYLYPVVACIEWWEARYGEKQKVRTATPYDEAHAQREAALAELAELELARKRKEQVLLTDVQKYLRPRMERVRSRALNAPGKYATRWHPCKNHGQAQRVLEDIVHEVLEDFRVAWVDGDDSNGNGRKRTKRKKAKRAKRKPRRSRK